MNRKGVLSSSQQKLVVDNMAIVYRCAKNAYELSNRELEWKEFQSIGFEALVKAALYFDESRKVKFSTYAFQAVLNTLISAQKELSKKNRLLAKVKEKERVKTNHLEAYSEIDAFIGWDSMKDILSEIDDMVKGPCSAAEILKCRLENLEIKEIAEKTGCKYQQIIYMLVKIRKFVRSDPRYGEYFEG